MTFFKQIIRNWKTVGAIAPSSPALAGRMADQALIPKAKRVLELGPGTGALTQAISAKLNPEASYIGVDINPAFVDCLSRRFPAMQFAACPIEEYNLDDHCDKTGGGFDAVVSGLPWTIFPQELQERILDHVLPRLAEGGRFVTFAYTGFHLLPSGQRFRSLLRRRLPKVQSTPTIWNNILPAFVYVGHNTEADVEEVSPEHIEFSSPAHSERCA